MKIFAVILFLLVLPVLAFAQTAPDTLWVKKYGSSGMNSAEAILQNSDGGFSVLGTTTTHGAGGTDILLISTTVSGDTIWTRTYGGAGEDAAHDFSATLDDGFIMVGNSSSLNDGHTYPYCLRVNAQGDTLWTRFLMTMIDGYYFSICSAGDGYMILGNANADVFLQRIDQNGDTLWSRFLGVGGNGRQIRATTDGGFVANGNNSGSMVSMKMDSVGNVLWYRAFRGGQSIGAAATSDGGVVTTGDGYGYFTGDRHDAAGNHIWSRTYGEYYNNGYCVVQAYDGSFVFGGYCNPNAEWSGVPCLYKTNTGGNVIWSDPFPYLYRGLIYRGIVTRDHGYAFIGWTNVDGDPQPFLVKLAPDPSNIIPCPPTAIPFIDNFDSPELDSCWTWIREDTSRWSLTERPGWMRILGDGHIPWGDNNATNILLRSVSMPNFLVETKMVFTPIEATAAGVLIYKDDANHISLYRDFGQGFSSCSETNDQPTFVRLHQFYDTCYLRITKIDSLWITEASPDCLIWTHAASWIRNDLAVNGETRVGVTNWDYFSRFVPADFDYFRVDSLPGTTVCGDVSGVWDSTGSPYYVTCDVTVPAGQTLEIRPGVQVLFTGHYKFNVFGNLQAIGTEQDSIIFTRAFPTEESKWWGIRFYDSADDASRLQYCLIEYGKANGPTWPDDRGGGIWCSESSPTITNCSICRNSSVLAYGGGIYCENSSATIRHCTVSDNSAPWGGGVHCYANPSPAILNCTISHNSASYGGAVCCESSSPTFNSSIIAFSEGSGIYFVNGSGSQILYCDLFGNSGGDIGFENHDPSEGPFAIGQLDTINGNGDPCDTYSNIFLDPMFVDTSVSDYHLLETSPCVDAGDPELTLDPDSTLADIGAFYFPQPNLLVTPSNIDFGLLDLGMDSMQMISLYNPTVNAVAIDTIFHSIPDFIIDTTGLGGQVDSHETYYVTVTFIPSAAGTYIDTLIIVAQQVGDDTIRIPLSGEAEVIPMPVEGLVIQRGPLNGIQLRWPPVTHSISGQPINADYIIYGTTSLDGPFIPFAYATDTTYVHPYILNIQSMYFYYVTAIPEGAVNLEKMREILKSRGGD